MWVHFTPGARAAWRFHSLGQALYVAEGEACPVSGAPILTIRPGHVGRTPTSDTGTASTTDHFMIQLSITEPVAEWGDHLSDAEHLGEPAWTHHQTRSAAGNGGIRGRSRCDAAVGGRHQCAG